MESSFLTRDQALSLWSRSTVLECLVVPRPLQYKTQHHPTTSSTLCRMPHLNNKQNKNTNPVTSRQDYHLTHPCPSEGKQTKKNSAQISPYVKLIQTTGPTLSEVSESHSVVSDSLLPHGLYSLWNSPGQNTEVGSLSLLQGIFPTQGSNPVLLHCRRILYQLTNLRRAETKKKKEFNLEAWVKETSNTVS